MDFFFSFPILICLHMDLVHPYLSPLGSLISAWLQWNHKAVSARDNVIEKPLSVFHFNIILESVTFPFHWVTQFQCFPLFFFYLCHFHFLSFCSHYFCITPCERLTRAEQIILVRVDLGFTHIFKHFSIDFKWAMTNCSIRGFNLWISPHFRQSQSKLPNPLKSQDILLGTQRSLCQALWVQLSSELNAGVPVCEMKPCHVRAAD